MKGNKLQLTTIFIQLLFSLPFIGLMTLLYAFPSMVAIVLHIITIVILHKAQRKTLGNYIGVIASLLSLTTYFVFVIDSFTNGEYFDNPEWAAFFIPLSWPFHIISFIVITVHYFKDKKPLQQETKEKQPDTEIERQKEKLKAMRQREKLKAMRQKGQIDKKALQHRAKIKEQKKQKEQQLYEEQLTLGTNLLLEKHREGFNLSIDTNIFLYEFSFTIIKNLVEQHQVPIYISMVTFNEIDLKKTDDTLGFRSREVIRFIESQQKQQRKKGDKDGLIRFMVGDINKIIHRHGLDFRNNDDKILAFTLLEQQQKNKKMLYISNDNGTLIKATPLGLEVFDFKDHIDRRYLR